MDVDYLIIGKGLIGSAAARYLSKHGTTLIIGPNEPKTLESHGGIFASHYDQGRLTREIAGDLVWAELAKRSLDVYSTIEQESGIKFHHPVGCVFVGNAEKIAPYQSTASERKAAHTFYQDAAELKKDFMFLGDFPNCSALAEPSPAGYINPRELIQAQLTIAQAQGTTVLAETVIDVEILKGHCKVTANETNYRAKKVLLTTGAYTNSFNLLEQKLELRVKSETVFYAEVSQSETKRLEGMPGLIYDVSLGHLNDFYLLPPILYPDGKTYIKLGANTAADVTLANSREMGDWMRKGKSTMFLNDFKEVLLGILPNLEIKRSHTGRCLVTYTKHRKPYVDEALAGKLYVATGGNGSGAKSSDALGHLAAKLVQTGKWQDSLAKETFALSLAKTS